MEQTINVNKEQEKNNQENSFYSSIRNRILNTDIELIFNDIIENNYKINEKDFVLLGNITYMFGNEFFNQKETYNKKVMQNFVLRMNDFKITTNILLIFNKIIENISVDNLIEIKDSVKNLILKEIEFKNQEFSEIRTNINSIFRKSNFEMQYAIEIDNFINKKTPYTYNELLKINKIIYENINMYGATFKNLNFLYKNSEFVKHLHIASEYFDTQKFSLIYFDSILSCKEYFESFNNIKTNINYIDFVEKPELIELIEEKLKINEITEVNENKIVKTSATPSETDNFVYGILTEVNEEKPITDVENLFETFGLICVQPDLVQHVYTYIKENKLKNRTEFELIFDFPRILFIEKLKFHLDIIKSEYKKLVETYVSEINPDLHNRTIDYVNDLIKSCVISNTERKSYLFSQLNENQIFTYKQLHQMIGLIEECNITGEDVSSYSTLRNFLTNNTLCKEVFDSIIDIERIQFEIQFFTGVLEFYSIDYLHN